MTVILTEEELKGIEARHEKAGWEAGAYVGMAKKDIAALVASCRELRELVLRMMDGRGPR